MAAAAPGPSGGGYIATINAIGAQWICTWGDGGGETTVCLPTGHRLLPPRALMRLVASACPHHTAALPYHR